MFSMSLLTKVEVISPYLRNVLLNLPKDVFVGSGYMNTFVDPGSIDPL